MNALEQEIQNRLTKCREKLVERNMEAYVITDSEDIWYLTNINYSPEQRPFFLIVFANQDPLFIVPKLEESHVQVPYFKYTIDTYFDVTAKKGQNWFEVVTRHLVNVNHVGVEDNVPWYLTYQTGDINWTPGDIIKQLRTIKSDYELDKIQFTAKVCSDVVCQTLATVHTGSNVLDLYMLPHKTQSEVISKNFSLTNRITNGVWPASYSYMPHSIPAMDAQVSKGPNVNVAVFKLAGYAAECERTFFTEEPTSEEQHHFKQMMQARKIMMDMIRPGVKASEVEKAVYSYFEEQGLTEHLLHRPGHGIGLNNHEEPTLSFGNDTQLKKNMVISVEPGLYFVGQGGYRHSDTVCITDNGYRFMTQAPDQLNELILK